MQCINVKFICESSLKYELFCCYFDRNLPWQWIPLYPECLCNGSSLAAGFGSGRKVRLNHAAQQQPLIV